MGFPMNPDKIIHNNLREIDIYNHYIKYKIKILEWCKNRNVMFYIATENGLVIKRKINGFFYKLTKDNFESIITGRTLSIHCNMRDREDIGIIDIDTSDFIEGKNATIELYDYVWKECGHDCEIQYTGKESFHIIVKFKEKRQIDDIRKYLIDILNIERFAWKYNINKTRSNERVNIDLLACNKINGSWICPYALSIEGRVARIIPRHIILNFTKG